VNAETDTDSIADLLELTLTGKPKAALSMLRPAIHDQVDDPRLWRVYGIALGMTNELEAGIAALRRALVLAPGDVWSRAYLAVQLHALGSGDTAADGFDYDELITEEVPSPATEGWSKTEFVAALATHVLQHPTLQWEAPFKATLGGWQTENLADDQVPVVRSLIAILRDRITRALREWAEGLEPEPARESLKIAAWGVVMDDGGSQMPHVHPVGVLSGVYYVAIPEQHGAAGALRFTRMLPWIQARPGVRDSHRYVYPVPGKLVMFPSYFWHETVPFEGPGKRVSIAFDVLPARP
jgi:uncharacterized protein (TIGR02466 family)